MIKQRPTDAVLDRLQERSRMKLTNREYEVLDLLVKGNSDKQIANELKISRRTVQTHMGRIYMKLGVNNRVSAATMFLKYFSCTA